MRILVIQTMILMILLGGIGGHGAGLHWDPLGGITWGGSPEGDPLRGSPGGIPWGVPSPSPLPKGGIP